VTARRAHPTRTLGLLGTVACCAALAPAPASATALKVTWMNGFSAPGTPAKYDKVGVIKVGRPSAKNVLVFEPGTSAAAAYFVPLAKWIAQTAPGWQVWAVQRRESLLEDQSELNLAKKGRANATEVFNYYLGFLEPGSHVAHHIPAGFLSLAPSYAKGWGMNVAVNDLHHVIEAARRLGGKVVLGGHSLGGSVVTAYATWNFGGRAGADDLAGLVYDDGASGPAEPASAAQAAIAKLNGARTPWLTFGGIGAPFAGIFNDTGSLSVLDAPNMPSLGQASGLLPHSIVPSVRVTNEAQYGFALNVATSPPGLIAAQAHLGKGISSKTVNGAHTWDGTGALTPIVRFAQMFAGVGILSAAGTEWYFPQRLTDDTAAVGGGIANPAQRVLDVHSTMGRRLPKSLLMFAFGARLGGPLVPAAARVLAKQSGIPSRNLMLFNFQSSYAHNDPAGAFPHNAFFSNLVKFLRKVALHGV